MFSFIKNRRRQKLLAQPWPAAWSEILARNVTLAARLPPRERQRHETATRIIVAERSFVGVRGLEITEEMKVTIAAQAALLLVGEEGYYFDRVPSIIVYPQTFTRQRARHEHLQEEQELLGEAWQSSSIVLSWPAVLAGGRGTSDGQNLVLHEFAHHLDSLDGEMGGSPPLPTYAAQKHWKEVFTREYDRLCAAVAAGRPTLLDPYGATRPAEMFAVASECFFERPAEMREQLADLYDCFRWFYKTDPASWQAPKRSVSEGLADGDTPTRSVSEGLPALDDDDEHHDPATPSELPPLETSDAYFTRGHEYFEIGRYDLAEADFNQAVRLAPDDQEALVYRAESRFWLDDVEAALADADRACRLDPRDKFALRIRGLARVTLDQNREGLADLAAALEPTSDDADGHFFAGLAHFRLGQPREALPHLNRVLELDSGDAEAFELRADCWEQLGDAAAAERDRRRADELRLETQRQSEGATE